MTAVPDRDPAHALVPHTLKEPLTGSGAGPLAGLSFMVKDLFAIRGRKAGNGNPNFYAARQPGPRHRAGHHQPARGRRVLNRHHHLR